MPPEVLRYPKRRRLSRENLARIVFAVVSTAGIGWLTHLLLEVR